MIKVKNRFFLNHYNSTIQQPHVDVRLLKHSDGLHLRGNLMIMRLQMKLLYCVRTISYIVQPHGVKLSLNQIPRATSQPQPHGFSRTMRVKLRGCWLIGKTYQFGLNRSATRRLKNPSPAFFSGGAIYTDGFYSGLYSYQQRQDHKFQSTYVEKPGGFSHVSLKFLNSLRLFPKNRAFGRFAYRAIRALKHAPGTYWLMPQRVTPWPADPERQVAGFPYLSARMCPARPASSVNSWPKGTKPC